jgi:EAL domain-containing protein (putative c-di-GMP-specific phosphodiesterase class I)
MFPDAFLARLESRGLMDRLWWTVARRAFSDVRRFEPYAGVQCGMSLNISVHSLQDLALPDRFSDLAKEYGVALESITIEITEGGLVKHLSKTLDVLARLRIKRVGLSIDDFGTGYSMMQQLQTIPATELKIDKSFVQKSRDSESDRIMVTKSVEIGHELGMKVVAEGVETIDQLEFLRELGCDIAQGYFFSRPKSAVELSVWLRDYSAMQMLPSPTTIINGGKSSSEGD